MPSGESTSARGRRGRLLDGQPTFFFWPHLPMAGYAIDMHDHGRLYRNGILVGRVEKIVYDRDVNGWWIHYEAKSGSWLDRDSLGETT